MVTVSSSFQDRYRVESTIATGGMGTVFVAIDERLNRPVALKVLAEDLSRDPVFVERFRREARSAAALSHPNVASVFDFGSDGDRYFIVMELAPGRNLAEVIAADAPLPAERTVQLAAQMCRALGHAHAAGVVHRDVKPANAIVSENDHVKVTDFGIARATGESKLTAAGSVLGTACYISPEHARGEPAVSASDVYSMGVVLFEMLTATVPFDGENTVGVALRHAQEEVPRVRSAVSGIPPGLDDVVARACAKDPRDRFHDGNEMAAALETALAGGSTGAPGTHPTTPLATSTVWPIPGDRWDPQRVGRWVIGTFLALTLVTAGLLIARAATGDDDRPARGARGGGEPARSQPAAAAPLAERVALPEREDLLDTDVEQLQVELDAADIRWIVEYLHPEEVGIDELPDGLLVWTNPDPGSIVETGNTVTLYLSRTDDDDDDDDRGPPEDRGRPDDKGKGKGKDKGKEDD